MSVKMNYRESPKDSSQGFFQSKVTRLLTPKSNNNSPSSNRRIKRSKIPPPLKFEPLSPPPTIQKNRHYDLFAAEPINTNTTTKSIINDNCSICQELISTKLSNERIIELECNHQCHYDCFALIFQKQIDITIYPNCEICSKQSKPKDEEILEELYSQTLLSISLDDQIKDDNTLGSPFLPTLDPMSGFKPNFTNIDTNMIPFTPLNQIIKNVDYNSNGFQSSSTIESSKSISSNTSSTLTFANSRINSPIPKGSLDELIQPKFKIISEFNKFEVLSNVENLSTRHVLNVFNNELLKPEINDELEDEDEIRKQIHDEIVNILQKNITLNKDIDLKSLTNLTMFEFFEISINSINYQFVNAFIFNNETLILINEEMTQIIGSISIYEHFNKLIKLGDTLILQFNTMSLPELTIRSSNHILLSKWEDYFHNLKQTHDNNNIPLIQMSTNLWDLLKYSNVKIPQEIIKFNELTSRGLDLPIKLMKRILPKPKRLPLNLILTIPLHNYTNDSNDTLLKSLQELIRSTLSKLEDLDKLGLVLIGKDGRSGEINHKNTTFYGMINKNWSGWDDIIDGLEVFDVEEIDVDLNGLIESSLKTCHRLISTIPEFNSKEVKSIRQIMMINTLKNDFSLDRDDKNDKLLVKIINDYKFGIHQLIINNHYDGFNKSLIDTFSKIEGSESLINHYKMNRFDSLTSLLNEINHNQFIYQNYQNCLINEFNIDLNIEKTTCVKFKNDHPFQRHFKYRNLDDGFYKNILLEIDIDVNKLIKRYNLPFDEFVELPIMELKTLTNNGQKFNSKICIKLKIIKSQYNSNHICSSPLDLHLNFDTVSDFETNSEVLNIPLLPPLSSFKDSIFIKVMIESMVLENLQKNETIIGDKHELISLIFGMIRGCSTNHMEFFTQSRFNKYKNFTNYVNELISKLNSFKDDVELKDFVYRLKLREEV